MTSPIRELRARRAVLKQVADMDPEIDHEAMVALTFGRVFPDAFFHEALLTVAFSRQVAIATMAPIIARRGRGDALRNTRKRINDTELFFGFMYRDGHSSPEARQTITRLAAIHHQFDIVPDDYRYAIASAIYEPDRMTALLGVPGLTARETRATFLFWTGVGKAWGLDIPEDQEAFRLWFEDYDHRMMARTDDCVEVARALRNCFLDRFAPGPFRPLGEQVLRALSDQRLRGCTDLPEATAAGKRLTAWGVTAYLKARRIVPGPERDDNLVRPWSAGYGGGLPDPAVVGPRWAVEIQAPTALPATGRCPF